MIVHDLIFDNLDLHGERTALLRDKIRLSYGELAAQVQAVAHGLRELGLKKGDRVAIHLNKRPECVISYFAASLAGAVFVPINPILKPDQVKHILNDCTVSVLITTPSHATAYARDLGDCETVKNLVLVGSVDRDLDIPNHVRTLSWAELENTDSGCTSIVRRIDNDVAAIMYTSGSTGKPKGVVLSHRNVTAGAISVSSYLENTCEDVILAALPFSFDAGLSQVTTAFSVGASVVLMDYLLPQDVPKKAAKFNVTALTAVPPLWNQVSRLNWPTEVVDRLRYIANTGGAMPTATLEKLRTALPKTTVYLMYGLTESFRSTYLVPEELDNRPTSIGKAIPNAEILVVREDGTPCDAGEPGELVHRGALVSLGYWNDPERTATRFRPVPTLPSELPLDEIAVWSGDTVVKDEQGFLYFVGRKDDMIKSSGYRISPTEIEEVIFKTGLVSECAALGIPHPDIGQAVVVAASAQEQDEGAIDAIIRACTKALPNYMVPARIIWQDQMPKNPNGKIDRRQHAAGLQDLFSENN